MKKFISLLSALFCATGFIFAQNVESLPLDPSFKVGKLDNGMTYYIRHNALPENRAEFYLATNVGAIQETPDQDGLAHFLEHMCFNGTKNFPEKSLLNWLESIGASFGGNVNASTGIEQTQYMLNNIPLTRPSIVDSCLLIMHDYSHFVTLDPKEIDAERGVILEEKRTRNTSGWRTFIQSKNYLYKGSKFADVSLIGSEDNLKNFKPSSLENFYHTWYRPDMQALIVIGDIDVNEIEAKIKTIFADIPAAENPKAKDDCSIPDNKEPIVGIITDKELSNTSVEIYWKSKANPRELNGTNVKFMTNLIEDIIGNVMNERFQDIASKSDAPFLGAGLGMGRLCEGTDGTFANASCKDGESITALKACLTEVLKMQKFGFSADEVERAKNEILAGFESAAKKADTRKNPEFVRPAINNFFFNDYLLDPQTSYEMAKAILPQFPAGIINQAVASLITPENMVVIIASPEKEGIDIPDETAVLSAIAEIQASEIQPNEAEEIPSSFLDPATLKGSEIKSRKAYVFDSEAIELKNGVKVILRPNDKEKDRIAFTLSRKGGLSLIEDKDLCSFEQNIWQLYVSNTGVAEFPNVTVGKMLAGKKLQVSPFIKSETHGISGSSTVKDFETALQLAYLFYESPRFDQEEYNLGINQIKAVLPNLVSTPDYKFQEQFNKTLFPSPRKAVISEEILEKASLQTLEKVYRQLFKGANGLTMIVSGDFDNEEIIPLIRKYVGSITKGGKATDWIDRKDGIADGSELNDFTAVMQQPKVSVLQVYKANVPYSVQLAVNCEALGYILHMVYTSTLREEEGGTYGASASAQAVNGASEYAFLQVYFDTNEEQADRLRELAVDGLRKLAAEGPTEEQFSKTVLNLQKKIPENQLRSAYWMSCIQDWEYNRVDMLNGYQAGVNALTPESIRETAKAFLLGGNFREVVMRPLK
ncbi:MAG: insulinase family protein [Bacteroidales bacterium]|nr:insulinase family protein [Bacteroidales bacterium]